MPPIRQVGHRQLEILLEFVEKNKQLVLATAGRSPFSQRQAKRAWAELALRLNSAGDGVSKSPVDWKRYWHLLKCRTKAKAANVWRGLVGTAGGPNKLIPLSDLEERIVAIIGKVSMERVSNPTPETQPSCSSNSPDQSALSSIEKDIEAPNTNIKLEEQEEDECRVELDGIIQLSPPPDPLAAPAPTLAVNSSPPAPSIVRVSRVQPVITAVLSAPKVAPLRTAVPVPSLTPAHTLVPAPRTEPALRAAPAPSAEPMPSPENTSSTAETRPRRPERNFRPKRNHDKNVPRWAYELEERRIATEERLVEEIADLNTTHRGILGCMQQLVQLLEGHLADKRN